MGLTASTAATAWAAWEATSAATPPTAWTTGYSRLSASFQDCVAALHSIMLALQSLKSKSAAAERREATAKGGRPFPAALMMLQGIRALTPAVATLTLDSLSRAAFDEVRAQVQAQGKDATHQLLTPKTHLTG